MSDEAKVRRLKEILKRDSCFSSWLASKKGDDPELFMILAERLAKAEREMLLAVADCRVLNLDDDLLPYIAELEKHNQELEALTLTDPLTGLYNIRYFKQQVAMEIKRSGRTGLPFSLMMLDVDNFKKLNDTLGHQEGNAFLIRIAQLFSDVLRHTDIGCRFGGDEFAVIMPATHHLDAMLVARRLREGILEIAGHYDVGISFSIGIAAYAQYSGISGEELIEKADRSLYAAKENGKNRICCDEKPETAPPPDAVGAEERNALLGLIGAKETPVKPDGKKG